MNHFKKFKINEIVFISLSLLLILFLIYILNVKTVQKPKETNIYLPRPWREWDWGREYGSYRYDDSGGRRAVGDTRGTSDWSAPTSSYPDTTVPYTRGSDWGSETSGIFAGLTKGEVEEHFIAKKAVHWPSTDGLEDVRYIPGSGSQGSQSSQSSQSSQGSQGAVERPGFGEFANVPGGIHRREPTEAQRRARVVGGYG